MEEAVCKEENESDDGYTEISLTSGEVKAENDVPLLIDGELSEPDESFHIGNYSETDGDAQERFGSEQKSESSPEKAKRGSRGFALGSVSDKIVPWLTARYERRSGGKTAIQEVIDLYSHDFPRDSIYFPLESFQVGQLVRQAFPNMELCKVTHKTASGVKKRYRCYKDLYRRDDESGPTPIFPFENARKTKPKPPRIKPQINEEIGKLEKRQVVQIVKTVVLPSEESSNKRPMIELPEQSNIPAKKVVLVSGSLGNATMGIPISTVAVSANPKQLKVIKIATASEKKAESPKFAPFVSLSQEAQNSQPPSTPNGQRLTREQELMLSELPTMKTSSTPPLLNPVASNHPAPRHRTERLSLARKVEIAKLHISQSLDHFDEQQFDIEEFRQIEEFIFERLDHMRATRFGQ